MTPVHQIFETGFCFRCVNFNSPTHIDLVKNVILLPGHRCTELNQKMQQEYL